MNTTLRKKLGMGILALLLTAFVIPAATVSADPGNGRQDRQFHKKGHHRSALGIWKNPQMIEDLELTGEQVNQIREADFAFREKRLTLKAQLDSQRLQMDKAFSEDTVDEAAVLSLAAKISDVKGQLFIQKIETRLEIRKLLNADQRQKLSRYAMDKKKQGRKQGKNRMYGKRSTGKRGNTMDIED